MDYRNWIIPILFVLGVGGYYFGKKISILFPIKKRMHQIIYYGLIYLFLSSMIIFHSSFIAFVLYSIILYLIFDFLHFIFKKTNQEKIFCKIYQRGVPILFVSLLVTIYGIYNATNPIVKEYEIALEKNLKNNITIGMISDLHLGTIHSSHILEEIVEHANQLHVDLFLLVGDIFDENTSEELKKRAYQSLSKIETKYGIYYVEGNHDLLTENTRQGFSKQGIHILDDKFELIDHQFYLVGRKDKRREQLGTPRKNLSELLKEISNTYPIILVDHQPVDQEQAWKLGVDLQLSGHTHAGQIFPSNYFLQYGYLQNEKYHLIVSSGYGVWGFSFRTAGRSEMVLVTIKGQKKE